MWVVWRGGRNGAATCLKFGTLQRHTSTVVEGEHAVALVVDEVAPECADWRPAGEDNEVLCLACPSHEQFPAEPARQPVRATVYRCCARGSDANKRKCLRVIPCTRAHVSTQERQMLHSQSDVPCYVYMITSSAVTRTVSETPQKLNGCACFDSQTQWTHLVRTTFLPGILLKSAIDCTGRTEGISNGLIMSRSIML